MNSSYSAYEYLQGAAAAAQQGNNNNNNNNIVPSTTMMQQQQQMQQPPQQQQSSSNNYYSNYQPTMSAVRVTPEQAAAAGTSYYNSYSNHNGNNSNSNRLFRTSTPHHSSSHHSAAADSGESSANSSCLVNPFAGGFHRPRLLQHNPLKKGGRNRNKKRSAAATASHLSSEASTASSPSPVSQSAQQQYNNNTSSGYTASPALEQLLTPPPPQDRSERRRAEYERQLRQHGKSIRNSYSSSSNNNHNNNHRSGSGATRRGLYEGELEPAGVRGQEARVVNKSSSSSSLPPIGGGGGGRNSSSLQIVRPVQLLPSSSQQQQRKNNNASGASSKLESWTEVSKESSYETTEDENNVADAADDVYDELRVEDEHYYDRKTRTLPMHMHMLRSSSSDEVIDDSRRNNSGSNNNSRTTRQSKPSLAQQLAIRHPPKKRQGSSSDPRKQQQQQQQQQQQAQTLPRPQTPVLAPQQQQRSSRLVPPPQRSSSLKNKVAASFRRGSNSKNNNDVGVGEDSTCSDDEIRNMLPDLVPPPDDDDDDDDEIDNNKDSGGAAAVGGTTPPNLLHSPSAMAQQRPRSNRNSLIPPPSVRRSHHHDRDRLSRNISDTSNYDNDDILNNDGSLVDVGTLNAEALQHVQAGQFDAALTAFTQVLHHQIQVHGRTHAATASAYHNLGTVHCKRAAVAADDSLQQRHCRAAALDCFQAAARSARDSSLGPNHPNVAVSLVRVGFLLLQSQQYQNAIITFQEALRIRVAHYGPQHGLVANLYNNLGVCCMHLGEFANGRQYLQQALTIQRRQAEYKDRLTRSPKHKPPVNNNGTNGGGTDHHWLELADTLFNLGGLCLEWIRRQGPDARRAVEAEDCFRECLDIRRRLLPSGASSEEMVAQVAALLEMARAVPRPRAKQQQQRDGDSNTDNTDAVEVAAAAGDSSPSGRYVASLSESPQRPPQSQHAASSLRDPPPIARSTWNANNALTGPGGNDNNTNSKPTIFRNSGPQAAVRGGMKQQQQQERQAPLLSITVSKEEEDNDDGANHDAPHKAGGGTRIYVAPHLIPESSPPRKSKKHQHDTSTDVVANQQSLDRDSFQVDESRDGLHDAKMQLQQPQQRPQPPVRLAYTYESEETCLINDTGVDSDCGRIHYPLAWSRAGILPTASSGSGGKNTATASQKKAARRDIMVTQPVRPSHHQTNLHSTVTPVGLANSVSSDNWGSETVNLSTGNKERDDLMARAKAILQSHGVMVVDSGDDDEEGKENRNKSKQQQDDADDDEDELLEDGVAPLGGQWSVPQPARSVRDMLHDPMHHVPEIHREAARQLRRQNAVDAHRLFVTVLDCQRHRHGPLHPDVAAALHNVGLAQLRLQNHDEALKAFEESARVRKGALGQDHPHVAVSLVKVGITLLLLHRFEEALWSFREALSVRKHSLGPLHPSTARIYNNIGCVYVEFNEFKEARRAFEAALDTQRSALVHEPESGPLMFATATTLCNLGYLYRYRDMHAKAASVLKEAVDLQEAVLGLSHATVLSTLDNLADSCANSGSTRDALRYYNMVLVRFRAAGGKDRRKFRRAEAVLLYKMSRVHRQANDRAAQLDSLKQALKAIRSYTAMDANTTDTLERRIRYDIRACREELEQGERNRL